MTKSSKLIICAGMQRSGSTLQYQIAKKVLSVVGEKVHDFGAYEGQNIFSFDSSTYGIVKSHRYLDEFDNELKTKNVLVLTSHRDIRDVYVSLMVKSNADFIHFFSKESLSKNLQDFKNWISLNKCLISDYKSLLSNLREEIRRIAEFLSYDLTSSEIENIYSELNLDKQREEIHKYRGNLKKGLYNNDTLLHFNHINNGGVDIWKEYLSNFEVASVQRIAKDWMSEYGYSILKTVYYYDIPFSLYRTIRFLKKGFSYSKIRGKLLTNRYNHLKSKGLPIVKNLGGDLRINLSPNSSISELIYTEKFENEEILFVKDFLNKGDVFIDIGANIGLFSLFAAEKVTEEGKVYSFEPVESTFALLEENVAINKMNNVELVRKALSNVKGTAVMNVFEKDYDAWNSFLQPSISKTFSTENVDVDTLDDYFNLIKIDYDHVKLVKIDVEGWEYQVLEGAKKLLSVENAPALMIEFNDVNQRIGQYTCQDIYEFVSSFGYNFYEIEIGTSNLKPSPMRRTYSYCNLIAIKGSIYR